MGAWSDLIDKISKDHLRLVKNSVQDNVDYLKYRSTLKDDLWEGSPPFSVESLKVGFAVTEKGENASAGDYFTALEFGEGLKKIGWDVTFLAHRDKGYWYDVPSDVDVLISLLDRYDPRRIRSSNKYLIKVAWPRNWFDRWVFHPGFSDYNLVFAPSRTAQDYINRNSDKTSHLLPLATNPEKFNNNIPMNSEFICDYCFTGNYWNDPRDIIEMLEPEKIPYKFNLYGKNWEKISRFRKYYHGFVKYNKLPEVYSSTKIVIDDANRVTKDYGSVNSRVFDALACGVLVITNGERGAEEIFNGKLPVYTSKEELNYLLVHYLDDEEMRIDKIKDLQNIVLEKHTYLNRAETLKQSLKTYINENCIV